MMSIAVAVTAGTNCQGTPVGAIIVQDHRVRAVGYNGTIEGYPNCFDGGCPRCERKTISGVALDECICAHGEQNALLSAARYGIEVEGAECWVTNEPCLDCTKSLIQAKVKVVRYWRPYPYTGPGDHQRSRAALRQHAAAQKGGTKFIPWQPGPKSILGLERQYKALKRRIDIYVKERKRRKQSRVAKTAKTKAVIRRRSARLRP